MRLFLLRHAQTEHNKLGKIQGRSNHPLDETGISQAKQIRDFFYQAHTFKTIYSSPLNRALETANIIARPFAIQVREEPGLTERSFGPWEGLTRAEIQAGWPKEFETWVSGVSVSSEILEDAAEVARRSLEVVRNALQRYENESILMVSHGATLNIMITALIGLNPREFRNIAGMNNCHYAELTVSKDVADQLKVRLLSLNVAA